MDVIIVAGISKDQGKQYSVYRQNLLTRQGKVMNYTNLRALFSRDLFIQLPDPQGSSVRADQLLGPSNG